MWSGPSRRQNEEKNKIRLDEKDYRETIVITAYDKICKGLKKQTGGDITKLTAQRELIFGFKTRSKQNHPDANVGKVIKHTPLLVQVTSRNSELSPGSLFYARHSTRTITSPPARAVDPHTDYAHCRSPVVWLMVVTERYSCDYCCPRPPHVPPKPLPFLRYPVYPPLLPPLVPLFISNTLRGYKKRHFLSQISMCELKLFPPCSGAERKLQGEICARQFMRNAHIRLTKHEQAKKKKV